MYENYDVAIIGGGPAAVFAAYEFTLKYPTVRLIMLEEGNPIERRQCRWLQKKWIIACVVSLVISCAVLAVPVLFRTVSIILRLNSAAG